MISNRLWTRHAVQALIWVTCWTVILLFDRYPADEFVGVIIVGYISWYVSQSLVSSAIGFVVRRTYQYTTEREGSANDRVSSRRVRFIASCLADQFLYGVCFIISGLMFLLTWITLSVFEFPPPNFDLRIIGLISSIAGLSAVLSIPGTGILLVMLTKGGLSAKAALIRTYGLVRANLQTRQDGFIRWLFGVNIRHHIERPAA